jgi:hypothetical protein
MYAHGQLLSGGEHNLPALMLQVIEFPEFMVVD